MHQCSSTSAKLPSRLSALCSAYIECVDETGVLEWNTADNTLVAFHQNISGILEMSPNNDHAFVINGGDGVVNVLTPAGT